MVGRREGNRLVASAMSKSKLIRGIVIPLIAILAFWWGGYLYFKSSSDWQDVQTLISDNPAIRAEVGEIVEISVGPFPFMYRFSGAEAQATLKVTVLGTAGVYRATIRVKRKHGVWSLDS